MKIAARTVILAILAFLAFLMVTTVASADDRLDRILDALDRIEQRLEDAPTPPTLDEPIDLNAAAASELQALPGVGPVLADRIIALRPYNNIDGLLNVPGIGRSTLDRLREYVVIEWVEPIEVEGPTLAPGDGWDGDLPPPAAIGTGFGADAQAIARWNVVPDQAFDGTFGVGVLAYHMLGIDRVAFSVNGGPWVDVDTISLNERTAAEAWATVEAYEGTEEYWVALDAADFTTGPVEVRAIAYPVKGLPRVLEPLRLWANVEPIIVTLQDGEAINEAAHRAANGRDASGVVVRLPAGEYQLGPYDRGKRIDTRRWLTIEPAEGVSREQVIITGTDGSDGMRTQRLRLHNLTITGQLQSHAGTNGALWVDRCELIGRGRIEPNGWTNGFEAGVWETNTLVRDSRHGMKADFSRNVRLKDIGENGWMSPKLVVDCYVTGIDRPTGADYHMDLVHLRSDENVIIHGLRAEDMSSQGIFTGRGKHLRNTAIVNCHIDNSAGGSQRVFQLMGPTEHLVVQSSAFVGSCNWRVDEGFSAHNVMLINSDFDGEPEPSPAKTKGVTVR